MEIEKILEAIKSQKDLSMSDCLSEYDGKIVKNHLPPEIKDRFLTKNQWLEKGFVPKKDATVFEFHPSWMNKKLCSYFLDSDIEPVSDSLECCGTCKIYKNRFCIIAGEHVSVNNRCSEYEKK